MRKTGIRVITAAGIMVVLSSCAAPKTEKISSSLKAPLRWTKSLTNSESPKNAIKPSIKNNNVAAFRDNSNSDNAGEARRLLEARNYRSALAMADRIIKSQPQNADALVIRGDCLHQTLRFEEACYSYKAALAIAPEHYLAIRGFGFSTYHVAEQMKKSGKDKEAFEQYRISIDLLRKARGIMPGDAQVTYGIALCCNQLSDYLGSRSLRLRNDNHDLQGAETMYNLSVTLCQEGIESLSKVAQILPKDPAPRSILANLYLRLAVLHKEYQKSGLATELVHKSEEVWQSILQDIDSKNVLALAKLTECKELLAKWQAQAQPVEGKR